MKGLFFIKNDVEWEVVSEIVTDVDGDLIVAAMRVSDGGLAAFMFHQINELYRKPEQKRMVEFNLVNDRAGDSIRIDREPMAFHGFTRDADGESCAILEKSNGMVLTEYTHNIRFVKSGDE